MNEDAARRQAIHETRQRNDDDHDRSSCVCCCPDCDDLFDELLDKLIQERGW